MGLIEDVPTVKELVDRIISEATEIVNGRLAGLLRPERARVTA